MATKSSQKNVAAIYARYSSSAQNDASIEQQYAECEQYARDNDYKVISRYEDRAVSGRSDRRPGFQRMIRAAERGEFQILLTYKSNRIARNMLDALRYEDRLANAGVKVIYCKEDFGNNAAGRMALRMMMSINEFYSENMSEDIKRGMKDSASKGKVIGSIPYGYKKGEDGKLAIDELAAPVIREIFRRVLNRERYNDIARDLNARGYKTKTGRDWNKNSFHSIISNERYTGVYVYDDIRLEGGIPAIVDKDLFDAVQKATRRKRLALARQNKNAEYLLTGKLFCGHCLAPMVGISGKGKGGNSYFYYTCQTRRLQHKCDKKNVRKDLIENEVIRAITQCVLSDSTMEWIADEVVAISKQREKHSQLAYYQKQLGDVTKQIANVLRAIEMGIIADGFKERVEELQREKETLEGCIAAEKLKAIDVDKDKVLYYLNLLRAGEHTDTSFQKMVIRDFVKAIYLYDDYFKIVINFTGKDEVYTEKYDLDVTAPDDLGVCIEPSMVYQKLLIQTPSQNGLIEATDVGFVITWRLAH